MPNSKGSIEVHAMLKHAMVTHQMLKRVLGGRSRHNDKAFNRRFVLDVRKLRNFLKMSEHCNDECPRDVSMHIPYACFRMQFISQGLLYPQKWYIRVYYIHIWRGLSRCSVQQHRVMRRPLSVERATLRVPRFVFIAVYTLLYL